MSNDAVQIYSIYIKAPAQQVWDAITQSEYTTKWGYAGPTEIDQRVGGTYRNLTTDEMKQMGLGEVAGGSDPGTGGGGWPWCLAGLKTLLETGRSMDEPAAS